MAEAQKTSEPTPAAGAPAAPPPVTLPVPPRRSPGHRGADVKDTVAEMAAKAHEISLEAGSKMAAAMKDVINAAAGLSGFVIESARDLVQYMVRRGQMTQEEADKLIREVESAMPKRKPAAVVHPPAKSSLQPAAKSAPASYRPTPVTHQPPHAPARVASKPAATKSAAKPKGAAKKPAAKKPAAKKPAAKKPAAKKPAAKKPAAKKPAAKKAAPGKTTSKTSAKKKPAAKKTAAKKAKRR
ncbi:MAG: hypothetical protein M3O61_05610 [Gemmatimonadota bacterium]|nr:hypothetical protein [Gemmatimonadota bacterium]